MTLAQLHQAMEEADKWRGFYISEVEFADNAVRLYLKANNTGSRRAERWKKAAKFWRSQYQQLTDREESRRRLAIDYRPPWWSHAAQPCIMCGDPFVHVNSNVCDACWRQETVGDDGD